MSVDTIGNFLTIIRNGVLASKREVTSAYSRLKYQIAQILKQEGFIKDVIVFEDEKKHKYIKIVLKYVGGESAIHEITRISTPGRRVYETVAHLKPVIGGLGVAILTTNCGVITDKQAKQLTVGGEVICTVW
jgi:small subunit ribosomal protein S8